VGRWFALLADKQITRDACLGSIAGPARRPTHPLLIEWVEYGHTTISVVVRFFANKVSHHMTVRWAIVWKAIKVMYALGSLVYFIGWVITSFRILSFFQWLLYVMFQEFYVLIWPVMIL
jgi:hypothetical protein